jgi:hypothetical protein
MQDELAILSGLSRQIAYYVGDCAEIVSEGSGTYRECGPSIERLAEHFSESAAQITVALAPLVHDGYVEIDAPLDPASPLPADSMVYPTPKVLKVHHAFEHMPADEIDAFLRIKHEDA